ncbi:MAG: trigger factor [Gammaproteobacteria bacterium]
MQVSVENAGVLERIMKVEIPEDRIGPEVDSMLQSMTRTKRVRGFRPGKVPLKIIKQHYAAQVREEVVTNLVQSSFQEALAQQKLRPACRPVIDPLQAEQGKGLAYTARFEVLPEVRLRPVTDLAVEIPACEVQETDIDQTVATLRRQHRRPRKVERAAMQGDQVNIDFHSSADGKPLEGGSGKGMQVEIGGKQLFEELEAGLIGKQAGEEFSLELTFPGAAQRPELTGKPVLYKIRINEVCELLEPEMNDAFFRTMGVTEGGEQAFRQEVRQHMQRALGRALRNASRDAVMRALREANKLELPKSLVAEETQRLQQQFEAVMQGRGLAEAGQADTPPMLEEMARKRVTLHLLVSDIVAANDLKAEPDRIRAVIEQEAAGYESPEVIINWYYSNKEKLAEAEQQAMEGVVVEWLLERAQVTEKQVSFDDIMNKGQTATTATA